MEIRLNRKQTEALSNFFLDLAKGIILGAFGFSAVASEIELVTKAMTMLISLVAAGYLIRLGVILLKQ